jgi:hypothetical protein
MAAAAVRLPAAFVFLSPAPGAALHNNEVIPGADPELDAGEATRNP